VRPTLVFFDFLESVVLTPPVIPLARPVFVSATIFILRFVLLLCAFVPLPALKNRGYITKLSTPYFHSAGFELAPFLLHEVGKVI
jgi:hypothetical protein